MTDRELIRTMRQHGIQHAPSVLRLSKAVPLGLPLCCAVLDQESGGGHNVFGHDRDQHGAIIWHAQPGRVDVTAERYRAYKVYRDIGPHKRMQGVGPLQLTWWSLQDAADEAGGCHRPGVNMLVGFTRLAELIEAHGARDGIRRYNGSGPAAERYASEVLERRQEWRRRFR